MRLNDLVEVEYFPETPGHVRRKRKPSDAQARGLIYEFAAQNYLHSVFSGYVHGPWFRYCRANGIRNWAQPDGFAIDPNVGIISVIEIKYKHTPDAYFQLYEKYIPLLEFWLGKGSWSFTPIEVCCWYDAFTVFPAEVVLQRDLRDARVNKMNVHIWRPPKEAPSQGEKEPQVLQFERRR